MYGGAIFFELRQEQVSPPTPMLTILKESILFNRMIWLLGFSYILIYLIRMAINDWGNIWLSETHGANLLSANAILSLFEMGGLLGALCSRLGLGFIIPWPTSTNDIAVFTRAFYRSNSTLANANSSLCIACSLFFSIGFLCLDHRC